MENFEKHFREQLAEHEMTPPAGFWHEISDALDKEELTETNVVIMPKSGSWLNSQQLLRIAAAVVLLLGVGGIIRYAQQPVQHSSVTGTPAVTVENKTTFTAQPSATMGHSVAAAEVQKTIREKTAKITLSVPKQEIILINNVAETENAPLLVAVIEQEQQMEQNVPEFNSTDISTNSVPVYSLKLLDKDVPENDEITVIKKEDPKKVIIIEKSLSKKPEIKYQLPLRF